jgi:hypothetical protein
MHACTSSCAAITFQGVTIDRSYLPSFLLTGVSYLRFVPRGRLLRNYYG